MKNSHLKTILTVSVAILAIYVYVSGQYRDRETSGKSLSVYLTKNGWQLTLGDLEEKVDIEKIGERKKYGRDTARIDNTGPSNEKLGIERVFNVDDIFADNYFSDKKSFIESSYVKSLSAYPEVVTNTIECPSEFKPKKSETGNKDTKILGYDFLTNDRFTYGVCSKDLITHRGFSVSVYCSRNKEIYNIEFSAPIDQLKLDFKEILSEIKCGRD